MTSKPLICLSFALFLYCTLFSGFCCLSSVTGSMSPGSTSQILARKKRRGVSLLLFLSFSHLPNSNINDDISRTCSLLHYDFYFPIQTLSVDNWEEAQRQDQPLSVRAEETRAQCLWKTSMIVINATHSWVW